MFPGGVSGLGTAYFTLSLENRTRTEDTIEVEFKFIIKHPHGGEDISECSGRVVKFSTAGSRFVGGVGPYVNISFAIQSSMYNYLVDGTMRRWCGHHLGGVLGLE